jgi:transposase
MANSHIDVIEFNQADLRAKASGATAAIRKRVNAVIAVARGKDPREVAAEIGAEPITVLRWVRAFNDGGYDVLSKVQVGRSAPMRSDFDANKIRKIANTADFPETKFRLLAIASMYDGLTTEEIAAEMGVSGTVLGRWRTNFNANGHRVKPAVKTAAKLDAEIGVINRTELKTVADIVESLTGEQREKAEAILMSSRSISVARICEALGRPRNWTVSVIKTFNGTGTETLFGIQNHAPNGVSVTRHPSIDLPEGYSVKSLSAAAREAEGSLSRDLYALSKAYLYKNKFEAAEAAGVSETRIELLVARLRKGGIEALVDQPAAYMELNADKVLHVAEGYKDKKAAAKLFALARVIRGESFEAVAADTGGDKTKLRELMKRLVRFGPDGIPDAKVWVVPEKPKLKTPTTVDNVATAAFSARVRKAVEKEKKELRKSRVPSRYFEIPAEPTPMEVRASSPFVSPGHLEFVRFMAHDAEYPGHNLAGAMLEYVETGNADEAARRFGVAETSIHLLTKNLGPTVEFYADQRVRKLLDDAGITLAKVKRLSHDCPAGWMSKLRSIGYLAERRSIREVSAITNVAPAKLLRWTAEVAKGWEVAEARLKTTLQPRRVAGMGR